MKKILLLIFLFISASISAQIKMSQLTEATTINTTDLFLLSKGDASRKLQFSTLKTALFNPVNMPLRLVYSGDSIRLGLSGDDAIIATSQNSLRINKPVYSQNNLLSTVNQLKDTAFVLRGLVNNKFPYIKSLESQVNWIGENPNGGFSYFKILNDDSGIEFGSLDSEQNTGSSIQISDSSSMYFATPSNGLLFNNNGFKYSLYDTTKWGDSTIVNARWVKDRLGSEASLTNGTFKASGSTFTYYLDSIGTGSTGGFYKFDGTQWPVKENNYALNGAITAKRFFAFGTGNNTPFTIYNDYNHSNTSLMSITNSGHNSKGISVQNSYDPYGSNKGIQIFNNGNAGIEVNNDLIKSFSNSGISIKNNAGSDGLNISGDSTGHLISLSQSGTGDLINSSKFRILHNGQVYYTGSSTYPSIYGYGDNNFSSSLMYLYNEGTLNSEGLHILNSPIGLNTTSYGAIVNNINGYCGLSVSSSKNKNADSYAIRAISSTASTALYVESDSTGYAVNINNTGTNKIINTNTAFDVSATGNVYQAGTFASIYRHRSLGDTTQSIPTGTTPTKVLAFSTNGEQSNCTADKNNDKITITKTGRYLVNLSLSYASGTNSVNWTAYVFKGGVECENIHSTGYTATANDKRSTSTSGIISVTSVPTDIDYRVTQSSGSAVNLIMTYVNLNVSYLGE